MGSGDFFAQQGEPAFSDCTELADKLQQSANNPLPELCVSVVEDGRSAVDFLPMWRWAEVNGFFFQWDGNFFSRAIKKAIAGGFDVLVSFIFFIAGMLWRILATLFKLIFFHDLTDGFTLMTIAWTNDLLTAFLPDTGASLWVLVAILASIISVWQAWRQGMNAGFRTFLRSMIPLTLVLLMLNANMALHQNIADAKGEGIANQVFENPESLGINSNFRLVDDNGEELRGAALDARLSELGLNPGDEEWLKLYAERNELQTEQRALQSEQTALLRQTQQLRDAYVRDLAKWIRYQQGLMDTFGVDLVAFLKYRGTFEDAYNQARRLQRECIADVREKIDLRNVPVEFQADLYAHCHYPYPEGVTSRPILENSEYKQIERQLEQIEQQLEYVEVILERTSDPVWNPQLDDRIDHPVGTSLWMRYQVDKFSELIRTPVNSALSSLLNIQDTKTRTGCDSYIGALEEMYYAGAAAENEWRGLNDRGRDSPSVRIPVVLSQIWEKAYLYPYATAQLGTGRGRERGRCWLAEARAGVNASEILALWDLTCLTGNDGIGDSQVHLAGCRTNRVYPRHADSASDEDEYLIGVKRFVSRFFDNTVRVVDDQTSSGTFLSDLRKHVCNTPPHTDRSSRNPNISYISNNLSKFLSLMELPTPDTNILHKDIVTGTQWWSVSDGLNRELYIQTVPGTIWEEPQLERTKDYAEQYIQAYGVVSAYLSLFTPLAGQSFIDAWAHYRNGEQCEDNSLSRLTDADLDNQWNNGYRDQFLLPPTDNMKILASNACTSRVGCEELSGEDMSELSATQPFPLYPDMFFKPQSDAAWHMAMSIWSACEWIDPGGRLSSGGLGGRPGWRGDSDFGYIWFEFQSGSLVGHVARREMGGADNSRSKWGSRSENSVSPYDQEEWWDETDDRVKTPGDSDPAIHFVWLDSMYHGVIDEDTSTKERFTALTCALFMLPGLNNEGKGRYSYGDSLSEDNEGDAEHGTGFFDEDIHDRTDLDRGDIEKTMEIAISNGEGFFDRSFRNDPSTLSDLRGRTDAQRGYDWLHRLIFAFMALIVAVIFFKSILGLTLGTLIAQFVLGLVFMFLPLILLVFALPIKSVAGLPKRFIKLVFGASLAYVIFLGVLTFVLLAIEALYQTMGAVVSPGTWPAVFLLSFIPIAAIKLIGALTKAAFNMDITSVKGAMQTSSGLAFSSALSGLTEQTAAYGKRGWQRGKQELGNVARRAGNFGSGGGVGGEGMSMAPRAAFVGGAGGSSSGFTQRMNQTKGSWTDDTPLRGSTAAMPQQTNRQKNTNGDSGPPPSGGSPTSPVSGGPVSPSSGPSGSPEAASTSTSGGSKGGASRRSGSPAPTVNGTPKPTGQPSQQTSPQSASPQTNDGFVVSFPKYPGEKAVAALRSSGAIYDVEKKQWTGVSGIAASEAFSHLPSEWEVPADIKETIERAAEEERAAQQSEEQSKNPQPQQAEPRQQPSQQPQRSQPRQQPSQQPSAQPQRAEPRRQPSQQQTSTQTAPPPMNPAPNPAPQDPPERRHPESRNQSQQPVGSPLPQAQNPKTQDPEPEQTPRQQLDPYRKEATTQDSEPQPQHDSPPQQPEDDQQEETSQEEKQDPEQSPGRETLRETARRHQKRQEQRRPPQTPPRR